MMTLRDLRSLMFVSLFATLIGIVSSDAVADIDAPQFKEEGLMCRLRVTNLFGQYLYTDFKAYDKDSFDRVTKDYIYLKPETFMPAATIKIPSGDYFGVQGNRIWRGVCRSQTNIVIK